MTTFKQQQDASRFSGDTKTRVDPETGQTFQTIGGEEIRVVTQDDARKARYDSVPRGVQKTKGGAEISITANPDGETFTVRTSQGTRDSVTPESVMGILGRGNEPFSAPVAPGQRTVKDVIDETPLQGDSKEVKREKLLRLQERRNAKLAAEVENKFGGDLGAAIKSGDYQDVQLKAAYGDRAVLDAKAANKRAEAIKRADAKTEARDAQQRAGFEKKAKSVLKTIDEEGFAGALQANLVSRSEVKRYLRKDDGGKFTDKDIDQIVDGSFASATASLERSRAVRTNAAQTRVLNKLDRGYQVGRGYDLAGALYDGRVTQDELKRAFPPNVVETEELRADARRRLDKQGIDVTKPLDLGAALNKGATAKDLRLVGYDAKTVAEAVDTRQALATVESFVKREPGEGLDAKTALEWRIADALQDGRRPSMTLTARATQLGKDKAANDLLKEWRKGYPESIEWGKFLEGFVPFSWVDDAFIVTRPDGTRERSLSSIARAAQLGEINEKEAKDILDKNRPVVTRNPEFSDAQLALAIASEAALLAPLAGKPIGNLTRKIVSSAKATGASTSQANRIADAMADYSRAVQAGNATGVRAAGQRLATLGRVTRNPSLARLGLVAQKNANILRPVPTGSAVATRSTSSIAPTAAQRAEFLRLVNSASEAARYKPRPRPARPKTTATMRMIQKGRAATKAQPKPQPLPRSITRKPAVRRTINRIATQPATGSATLPVVAVLTSSAARPRTDSKEEPKTTTITKPVTVTQTSTSATPAQRRAIDAAVRSATSTSPSTATRQAQRLLLATATTTAPASRLSTSSRTSTAPSPATQSGPLSGPVPTTSVPPTPGGGDGPGTPPSRPTRGGGGMGDGDGSKKGPKRFQLPDGKLLPEGVYPKRVTFLQGLFRHTIDLEAGKRTVERSLTSGEPDKTFKVISTMAKPPKRQRYDQGAFDYRVDGDSIDFIPDKRLKQRQMRPRNPFKTRMPRSR